MRQLTSACYSSLGGQRFGGFLLLGGFGSALLAFAVYLEFDRFPCGAVWPQFSTDPPQELKKMRDSVTVIDVCCFVKSMLNCKC